MENKTYSFTFEIGEDYTNGEDNVKIVGLKDDYIVVNDGRDFDINVEVKEFITEWWKPEED